MAEYTLTGIQKIQYADNYRIAVIPSGNGIDIITIKGYSYAWDTATSDNGYPIWVYYTTKDLDFSDQDTDMRDVTKTIRCVRVKYEDLDGSLPLNVYISNDGGVNWSHQSAVLGNGDGAVKTHEFYFMDSTYITGEYFRFRFECLSTTKRMKLLGIDIEYVVRGQKFEVS